MSNKCNKLNLYSLSHTHTYTLYSGPFNTFHIFSPSFFLLRFILFLNVKFFLLLAIHSIFILCFYTIFPQYSPQEQTAYKTETHTTNTVSYEQRPRIFIQYQWIALFLAWTVLDCMRFKTCVNKTRD